MFAARYATGTDRVHDVKNLLCLPSAKSSHAIVICHFCFEGEALHAGLRDIAE